MLRRVKHETNMLLLPLPLLFGRFCACMFFDRFLWTLSLISPENAISHVVAVSIIYTRKSIARGGTVSPSFAGTDAVRLFLTTTFNCRGIFRNAQSCST